MNRRNFLKNSLLLGSLSAQGISAPVLLDPAVTSAGADLFRLSTPQADSAIFSLGVASGDPTPHGIVLWTRVAPEARAGAPNPNAVAWQISTGPEFTEGQILLNGIAPLDAARDTTVKVLVQRPELQPFTRYFYRFLFNGRVSRTGQFKTLPDPNASLSTLRLGYISCQDYTNGYYSALRHLARENVDYIIHLGDYIYESVGDTIFQEEQVRPIGLLPSGSTVAATLEDYRFLYRTYRLDADLQNLHATYAFFHIWDDHEFANDSYQDFHPDNNPTPEQPTPSLRQSANQAWCEYIPSLVSFDPAKPSTESVQLYRAFSFGNLADLVLTDQRLYRDGPPCGLAEADRYVTSGCDERFNEARSMLGATQRDWFLNSVKNSGAAWKIWGTETMMMALRLLHLGANSSLYVTLDAWDGYPAERKSILSALRGVKNLVAVTGDIHSYAAGYLRPDYDNPLSRPMGVELVGASVTSANFKDLITSNIPLNSAPVPKGRLVGPQDAFEPWVKLNNPHIEFFDSSSHGYVIVEITPSQLQCWMKSVSGVATPNATLGTLASYVVPKDQVTLIKQ